MKKNQEQLNKLLKIMADRMSEKGPRTWPPECSFVFYQPVRPSKKAAAKQSEVTEK